MNRRHRNITLGAYLRQAREAAGLSLRQVEDLTGVGRMALSRLENDAVQEPQTAELAKLARVYELNETDLLLRAGLPVPKEAASLEAMLRKDGIPDEDIPELTERIQALIAEYNKPNEGRNT